MRKYECVVILSGQLNDERVKEESKKIEGVISANKGINITLENWGRKTLSYELKKESQGTYICFTFDTINHEAVSEISSLLRISEPVLKFQIHRKNLPVRKFKGNPQRLTSGPRDWASDEFSEEAAN